MFFFDMNIIIILYCICTLATWWGACSQKLDHYETLVLSVVYFVLKMLKNIDFHRKTSCTRGVHRTRIFSPEQECNLVTVFV